MNRQEVISYLDAALAGLKDFQAASVEAIVQKFYQEGRPRFLVADEVGLGKTIVARGLISRVLKERINHGLRLPLRVTYICSNQVIAKSNTAKLNPFPAHHQNTRSAYLITISYKV